MNKVYQANISLLLIHDEEKEVNKLYDKLISKITECLANENPNEVEFTISPDAHPMEVINHNLDL